MTIDSSRDINKIQKGKIQDFKINKEVLQGDALSITIFNDTLEYVVGRNERTLRNREGHIVAYADETMLITRNRRTKC